MNSFCIAPDTWRYRGGLDSDITDRWLMQKLLRHHLEISEKQFLGRGIEAVFLYQQQYTHCNDLFSVSILKILINHVKCLKIMSV